MELPYLERLCAVPSYTWVMFLHYARRRRPVKELYRFRQIRRAGFVHHLDERISPGVIVPSRAIVL